MKNKAMLVLCFFLYGISALLYADELPAQRLHIYTQLDDIVGKPSWLLELRDVTSGRVLPYLFDIQKNTNVWVAFSKERAYRVVASIVTFGPYAKIYNFCGVQDGILVGKSMHINIHGILSPNARSIRCKVTQFS